MPVTFPPPVETDVVHPPLVHPPSPGSRCLPEETAVALAFDGSVQAVMMATPGDLWDFIAGFALTEGITRDCPPPEILRHQGGIELRVWLGAHDAAGLAARRRAMAGPVGCGLCGIDSLAEALRTPPRVAGALVLAPDDPATAEGALRAAQPLRDHSGALHAAGFFVPGRGLVAVREDVGRHNALDKLAGALARGGIDPSTGAVVLTSRVSVEMVQKTAMLGAPAILAVSAPTALAVRTAAGAGITLLTGIGRPRVDIHSHPHRIAPRIARRALS